MQGPVIKVFLTLSQRMINFNIYSVQRETILLNVKCQCEKSCDKRPIINIRIMPCIRCDVIVILLEFNQENETRYEKSVSGLLYLFTSIFKKSS